MFRFVRSATLLICDWIVDVPKYCIFATLYKKSSKRLQVKMKLQNIKIYAALPDNRKIVVQFFLKLFLLFTAWFFAYTLFIGPSLILDSPLTNFITISVVKLINFLTPSPTPVVWDVSAVSYGDYIMQNGVRILNVGHKCNGIDLMFTYISIIVLLPYPNPLKRKILFCIGGIIAITLANIIRVSALYYIHVYQKAAFDFSHHYLFTILMYVLIFYGWLLFIKNKSPQ